MVTALRCLLDGIIDAISFHNCAIFLFTSKTIRIRALQCFFLNGVLFLGSMFIANHIIIPIMQIVLSFILPFGSDKTFIPMFENIFHYLHSFFWLYPIYSISFILNSIWYQDIADAAYIINGFKPLKQDFTLNRFLSSLSQDLYRVVLVGIFYLFALIISYIPYIGPVYFFFSLSMLYSFYSFEYKWNLESKDINLRIAYFESHWLYFFGFGLPSVLLGIWMPGLVYAGLFALLFPAWILLAITAKPVHYTDEDNHRLPVFYVSKKVSEFLLRILQCGRRSSINKDN